MVKSNHLINFSSLKYSRQSSSEKNSCGQSGGQSSGDRNSSGGSATFGVEFNLIDLLPGRKEQAEKREKVIAENIRKETKGKIMEGKKRKRVE